MIATQWLASATAGTAYPTATLAASGGVTPETWSVTAGALPAGLTLDATTGALSGTPTTAGTYDFTVAVTDSEQTPATVTQPLEIVVAPAATSTDLSASVPTVAAGGSVTYTATVDAPVLPTGDVDFTDNNTAVPSCQGVALSATVPHTATCTLTYDTAGDHSVTATYDGDTSTSTSTSTSATVTVSSATSPLNITTTSMPSANAGTAYPTATLAASGGVTPETWSVTAGALPAGLALDATTGALSGTPTTAGTYDFTVGVTDSETTPVTATADFSITVAPATTSTDLSASASSVATGTAVTYTATVTSPVTPTGTVDFSDAGSPISTCQNVALTASAPYTATCTLTYSAGGSHPVSADYSGDTSTTSSTSTVVDVTVTATVTPLSVSTTSVPAATAGSAYPDTVLAASGGTGPYSWSVTSGSLPPGLSLDASSGTLSGTPTTGGTYPFTVGVTDSETIPVTATADFSITVAQATTTTGIGASASSVATGTAVTYTATVTSPVTPTGTVDFSDAGSPISTCQNVALTASAPYTATCTLTYSAGGSHPVSADYSGDTSTTSSTSTVVDVTVTATVTPLSVSTTSVPAATAGSAYPDTVLAASGGTGPYSWSVTSGSLPPGLSLDASSGTLSGTPTTGGTYPFTVGVTDSETIPVTATADFSITVAQATTTTGIGASASSVATGTAVTYTATVTSPVTPTGTVDFSDAGSPISTCQNVALTASAPYTATCTLTYSAGGSHPVSADYSGDTSTTSSTSTVVDVTVTANLTPLAISTTSVPAATAGSAYPDTVLAASGGTGPYSWSVTSGSLPPGLSLDASSGTLSGTPTTGGTYPFTVGVTDSETIPVTATADFSITVAQATTTTGIGASASSVATGTAVTYTATVTSPVTPTGTVDFSDAGSPISTCQNVALTASAPYTATCTLTYSAGGSHPVSADYSGDTSTTSSTSTPVDVTVTANLTPLAISTTSVPAATAGSAYPDTVLAASGGQGPYSWSVTSGSLPPGLSLDASSGTLSGTPTTGGTYPFTVGVTDSETIPVTATADFSITVAQATTTTGIGASASSVATGTAVTYTATVTSPVTPTGTVDFSDAGSPISTCQNVALTASAPYTATCTLTYSAGGSHPVSADYSGDTSTTSSTSTVVDVTVTATVTPLSVSTTSVPAATAGSAYPDTVLAASGGTGPYSWSVTSGSLPPGLSLDASSGTLSGTPTTGGTYPFTVGVTDSETIPVTATADFSITVAQATTTTGIGASASSVATGTAVTYTATVTSPVTPTGTVDFSDAGSPISTCQNVALTASAPYTATCTLTYSAGGSHPVSADYSGDTSTTSSTSTPVDVTVTANLTPPRIVSASSASAMVGQQFVFTIVATGTPTPDLAAGRWWGYEGLPPGIEFTDDGDGTATLSGTPRQAGIYIFTIKAINEVGVATQVFEFFVHPAPPRGCQPGWVQSQQRNECGGFGRPGGRW